MEERVNELLPLAAKIAREFSNIHGLPHAEINMAALEALANAARHFDPDKGEFTAYACRAMRNALRDLHDRQVHNYRHHIYDLDLPITDSATTPEARVQQMPPPHFPAAERAATALESRKRLKMAMKSLTPRRRLVAEGIRDGKSYSEIGSMLGGSKQAAHKLAGATIAALRDRLEAMGFKGVDTLGFLKSCAQGSRAKAPQVDDSSAQP